MSAADPKDWAEALAAFEAWTDLPASDQDRWLSELASHRPKIHAAVVALIRADRDADKGAFLEVEAAAAQPPGLEGRRFGPWLIERLIGRGGMGHVWLARRTDGLYDGRAAIKLMRLASVDAVADERFAREGRMLGRLNHPHIAKLLDAGLSPSGERYLVLEFVEGERIDRWCDAHRSTLAERIALFIAACQAVAHAHANLVVHRDLKPSNIFVTTSGDVKLLDFGVAKLLEDEGAESAELTRDSGVALTPLYAAPEQLEGGAISTATDVYGLGLVLFGLLNGSHPFDDGTAATRESRALARAEPKPLWSLPADAAKVEGIAAARSTHPAALAKFLHGDVAVVVGKALKNDPAERYRSVPELADDLQRTLEQRPIAARPDSAAYRGAKFVRRHWMGVGAALVIVLAVAGGITGTLLKQHEADRQAREAERQAERAVAVKRFLLELFDQARSAVKVNGVQAREATIGDILNAGADRVDRAFVKQPEIRDEIFEVLTNLYSESDDRAQMTALARKRLAAARSSFGADDRRTVPAEVLLAGVLLGYAESGEAKALLDHAQGVLDRVGDNASFDRARLLRWQGVYLQFNEPAAPWPDHPLRRSLALMHQHFADDDELMEVLVGVPGLACRAGYVDEALAAADELQQRALAKYGIDNIFTAEAMQTRGNLLMLMGRPEEGIPLMQEAIEGFAKFTGRNSPDVIAATLGLAQAQFAAGHAAAAADLYQSAAATVRREHAGDAQLAARLARYRTNTQRIEAGDRPHCGA